MRVILLLVMLELFLTVTIRYISSKDAYMLVYARVGHKGSPEPSHPVNGSTTNGVPQPSPCQATPPAKALEVVNNLNIEHRSACDDYARRSVVHF